MQYLITLTTYQIVYSLFNCDDQQSRNQGALFPVTNDLFIYLSISIRYLITPLIYSLLHLSTTKSNINAGESWLSKSSAVDQEIFQLFRGPLDLIKLEENPANHRINSLETLK